MNCKLSLPFKGQESLWGRHCSSIAGPFHHTDLTYRVDLAKGQSKDHEKQDYSEE